MELTIKSTSWFLAILLTGLSAGFFLAWSLSVIPGTLRISDSSYLETMQQINRAILNPAFFAVFFGPLLLIGLSSYLEYRVDGIGVSWMLISFSGLFYLIGTFGVTAFGNVPLNDALDIVDLVSLGAEQLKEIRLGYEVKWNRLHMIRTFFSVLSFILLIGSLFAKEPIA